MPRTARIVLPGVPHHITHRGNNRQTVFHDEHDYTKYYQLLLKYSRVESMRVLGYCLMPNHVHIVAVPSRHDTFDRAFRETQRRYTTHFNRKRGCSGHLWQNRFYSCPMDESHTLNALAYIELNPVRARMVATVESYTPSSAAAHCEFGHPDPLLNLEKWFSYWTAAAWKEHLSQMAENKGFCDSFRRCTQRGTPLGDAAFRQRVRERIEQERSGRTAPQSDSQNSTSD